MKRGDAVAAVILDSRGWFLLQKKDIDYKWYPGKWCLFGGFILKDETPKMAIVRELKEELGPHLIRGSSKITLLNLNQYSDKSPSGMRSGNLFVYLARFSLSIKALSINEGAGFALFSQDEIQEYRTLMIPRDYRVLRDCFIKRSGPKTKK